MGAGQVTIKMYSEEHQALMMLLRYIAKQLSAEDFAAVMRAQGRNFNYELFDRELPILAEMLLMQIKSV